MITDAARSGYPSRWKDTLQTEVLESANMFCAHHLTPAGPEQMGRRRKAWLVQIPGAQLYVAL